ncbi:MAG: hypothetical protein HQ510_08095 [Candidatus Marinimicrobia bacterium]|nr:hypothetical protein [Candidatus Neomarinimicrobiota bacterium]
MKYTIASLLMIFSLLIGEGQTYSLQYLSPNDLIEALNLTREGRSAYVLQSEGDPVEIYLNQGNNIIRIFGSDENVRKAIELITFFDSSPLQFSIQIEIIEINRQNLENVGMDWQSFLDGLRLDYSYKAYFDYDHDIHIDNDDSYTDDDNRKSKSLRSSSMLRSTNLNELINVLKANGIGETINSPKIVTVNNKKGKILDGSHSTYITRYSSYANIYETEEINAGLSLEVTPSLGEGGYIYLDIEAKYTSLISNISGSPVEFGQILENQVYVKEGEPFLLGSFKKTEDQDINRKVPVLGTILPFLFSNKKTVTIEKDILVVLTPTIINLEGSPVPELNQD